MTETVPNVIEGKLDEIIVLEIIEAVMSVGGRLTLRDKRVHCRIPDNGDARLIEALRERREAVARLLRLQQGQGQYVCRDNRCYTHGTHEEWYRHPGGGPDRVCAKCHPRIDHATEWGR
jgi:hypothetical protein